ncbi:MAG: GMC family oxidoreductase [Acidobacteriota bacterium]
MTPDKVDAVIVGAGASGGVVAHQLAHAGLRVVLLERGSRLDVKNFQLHDEMLTRGNLYPPFNGLDRRHPREFRHREGEAFQLIYPDSYSYPGLAAAVGGGQLFYGGLMWRFLPIDFRAGSEYGPISGSTLSDWPLTYEDLEPFYDLAEQHLGVAGEAGVNPFDGKRRRPFPLPPVQMQTGDLLIQKAARRLGYHPFTVPLGIATEPYKGRNGCIRHPCCNLFICEIGAKSTIVSALLPATLATGNCRLVTEAVVKEVTLDGKGRPDGVAYFDQGKTLVRQPAHLVILAASATETPRLLLNSRSRWFPKGLGNRNDWVGRNLMDHIGPSVVGFFEETTNEGLGPGPGVAIDDFYGKNPGFAGGGVIYNRTEALPMAFANIRPQTAPRWGKAHKEFQRKYFRRYCRLWVPGEMQPQFENRVEISPSVRDAWGIPVARLTHHLHPNDYALYDFFREKMVNLMREAGAFEVVSRPAGQGGVDAHQCGTCRMGNDPKTSVVDRFGRLHDLDNVFVVDGSLFVTSGGRNPALTIQALAYWVSDHIIREWKGGGWQAKGGRA